MTACFGTADFWRLRIGIGRPGSRLPGQGGDPAKNTDDIAGWVLADFSVEEAAVLASVFSSCGAAFVQALLKGPQALLPEWAKKKIDPNLPEH
jgi:PTH1 family peptidyl-tRNA hydrolase